MHASSLKVLTRVKAYSVREERIGLVSGRIQVGFHRRNVKRSSYPTVLACAPQKNGGGETDRDGSISDSGFGFGSSLSRSLTYALLKKQMKVAAEAEDYKEAARLRDSLRSFVEDGPILRLGRLMNDAVIAERFEDAVKYHDELKNIAPSFRLKCSSDATTLGIRVQVRSSFIDERSQPSKGHYVFAYRIHITNNSDRPVQLLKRHWIVTDTNGKTENVWGVGVAGEQPVILPGTGFVYSSACSLTYPMGRMEGEFEMKHVDGIGTRSFNVLIAPFCLALFGDETGNF